MNKDTPETNPKDTPVVADAPTETTAPKAVDTSTKPASKPSHRKTKSWVIIAAILLVIIGIGAYLAWTMQPANAIVNSISNLAKNRSDSFSFESKSMVDGKLTTTASGQVGYKNDQLHIKANVPEGSLLTGTLEVKHLGEDGTYVKATGIERTIVNLQKSFIGGMFADNPEMDEQMMASIEQSAKETAQPIVEVVEDKWIMINQGNVKDSIDKEASETYKCVQESMSLLDKSSSRNEIQKLYREHQFVVIEEKLGTKDGAIGFVVSLDDDKLDNFTDAMKDTDFYKKIQECTESEDEASAALDNFAVAPEDIDTDNVKLELWIDRFGHNLRTAEIKTLNDNDEVESVLKIDFTKDLDVDFKKPENSTSLEEIFKSLDAKSQEQTAPEDEIMYTLPEGLL